MGADLWWLGGSTGICDADGDEEQEKCLHVCTCECQVHEYTFHCKIVRCVTMVCHNLLMQNKMSLRDFLSGCEHVHEHKHLCSLYVYECALINCTAKASRVIHSFISRLQSDEPKKISRQCKQTLYKLLNTFVVFTPQKFWFCQSYRFDIKGMQTNIKHEDLQHRAGQENRYEYQNIQGRKKGTKIHDAHSLFLIPLSVCMSDRDQRWRNVT